MRIYARGASAAMMWMMRMPPATSMSMRLTLSLILGAGSSPADGQAIDPAHSSMIEVYHVRNSKPAKFIPRWRPAVLRCTCRYHVPNWQPYLLAPTLLDR